MKRIVIAVILALLPSPKENARTLENLEKARLNLKRQSDAVDRAKSQIKISEVLLTLVKDAIIEGSFETMEERLNEYSATIQDAHTAMLETKRDASRKPGGFKDLEISLRKQLRQLKELDGLLSYDRRQPVERASVIASDIQADLLKSLFGEQNAKKNRD